MRPVAWPHHWEYRALFPGASQSATGISTTWLERWTGSDIPRESNQWRGNNRGAYSDSRVDQWYEDYLQTVEEPKRHQVHAEIIKRMADEVSYIPNYYQIDVLVHRAGIRGPGPNSPEQLGTAWNIQTWEMD